MKKALFLIFFQLLWIGALAQGAGSDELESRIIAAHEGIVSITSDFTQTKVSQLFDEPVVQKGKFEYSAPESLVWEYKWPTELRLDMSDIANKMTMMLKDVIINAITGVSLTDRKSFEIGYSNESDGSILVSLTPKSRTIAKMFRKVCLRLDGKTLYASSVSFEESNGDSTSIMFNNQVIKK